ncbi:MAG: hypothetical protein PHF82_08995, partial [Lutispora sp.]|nr:hypothetical protein [Lutispora sp.]
MIDTTDVAANVNYPSDKKLICDAFRKTIKEMRKFNEGLAAQQLEQFEKEILRFKFEISVCRKCPLNEKCMRKYDGKIPSER